MLFFLFRRSVPLGRHPRLLSVAEVKPCRPPTSPAHNRDHLRLLGLVGCHGCRGILALVVRKLTSFSHHFNQPKTRAFAKTGSGQTPGKHSKEDARFLTGHAPTEIGWTTPASGAIHGTQSISSHDALLGVLRSPTWCANTLALYCLCPPSTLSFTECNTDDKLTRQARDRRIASLKD